MRFSYFYLLAVVLALAVAGSSPVQATGTVEATSTAQLSNDPGFEGLWRYTVVMTWDLDAHDLGHLDFFLAMEAFRDTCTGQEILFPMPAGSSSGQDPMGFLCQLTYTGEFQCKTDPSLKLGDLGYSIKYEPVEVGCQTRTEGSGVFQFYTYMAPGVAGLHEDALAVKHGQDITFGDVDGHLPHMDGYRNTGVALINEFLVRPARGDIEFIELFNPNSEPVNLNGWEIVINNDVIIPLTDSIPAGGYRVDTTAFQGTLIDFDFYPNGDSIPTGTQVNSAYWPYGVGLVRRGGTTNCGDGFEVYANDDQPAGFGSPPNVGSPCWDGVGAAFSEGNGYGYIEAYFNAEVQQVCIDVDPMGVTDQGVLRVYGGDGVFLGEVQSTPGVRERICFETTVPEIWSVEFTGLDTTFAYFDNLLVSPQPPPFIITKGNPLGPDGTQIVGEGDDFLPDKGGIIILVDNNGVVQDSVGYGNQGGAPISAPLVVLEGTEPPPGFKEPGYVAAEDETLSTSSQRILDGWDSNADASDFNVARPTPEYTNNGEINDSFRDSVWHDDARDLPLFLNSVSPPELGSGIRLNTVYAYGDARDGIELYNPTSSAFDLAGWHVSDGSIIEPVLSGGGERPLGPSGATELVQNMPESFTFEMESDDVLYLYNRDLVRLDQMGWTRVPTFFPDSCMLRNPDGAGPADGYDWNTSGGLDGTLIYDNCGLQLPTVAIVPQGHQFQTSLAAPYPNPARGASTVSFTIGGSGSGPVPADIVIYDVAGRRVRTLMSGEFKPGIYRAVWNGLHDSGMRAAAGVYFVRMRVENEPFGDARSLVWLR